MKDREKNAFGENKWIAHSNFYEKMKELKAMHPQLVKNIYIVWQCEWQALKREDEAAKYFLKKIYRHPPLFRLDPEKAGDYFCLINS